MQFLYILNWDLDPEITTLFGVFPLRYYGLLFVSGILIGYEVVKSMYKAEKVPVQNLEKLFIYLFVGMLAGMRLGHCLFYDFAYYSNHFLEIFLPFQIQNGNWNFTGYTGLASHGGVLGILISITIFTFKTKTSFLWIADRICIGALITGAFIRLGNFMNSEIYGKPTNADYGVVFMRDDLIPRHPAQLYEAFSYLLIFGILWYAYKKKYFVNHNGYIFGISLILVFFARFTIEFFKENQVAFEDTMTLNMGQWLSIPFIIIGIALLILPKYLFKKSVM